MAAPVQSTAKFRSLRVGTDISPPPAEKARGKRAATTLTAAPTPRNSPREGPFRPNRNDSKMRPKGLYREQEDSKMAETGRAATLRKGPFCSPNVKETDVFLRHTRISPPFPAVLRSATAQIGVRNSSNSSPQHGKSLSARPENAMRRAFFRPLQEVFRSGCPRFTTKTERTK